MLERCAISTSASTRRRSKRWQRDSTVTGTLRISVVANTNLACSRRLLQRLQEGVEGRRRQHVDFVDDVDLVARAGRRVAHAVM